MKCDRCDEKTCYTGRDCSGLAEDSRAKMLQEPAHTLLRAAAQVEADHYMQMTRVEETLRFAELIGAKKLGVAFCPGLSAEARRFCEIAEDAGFEVSSVCCKVCGIDKHEVGLKKLWNREHEASCNPMGQAAVLNRDKTDLNILIGLCVGHDALFLQASEAPATVLVAKDRVMAHNPVGALYSNYHRHKFEGALKNLPKREDA